MAWRGRLRTAIVMAALYASVSAPMFAIWEIAQLPLYTIWAEKGVRASLWAAFHCTLGDLFIAFVTIFAALIAAVIAPRLRTIRAVAAITIASGFVITGVIEVASVRWFERWAYSPLMPVEPFFGIGLSPLALWIVAPALTLFLIRRRLARALSWERRGAP